jgi:hypothetical protein
MFARARIMEWRKEAQLIGAGNPTHLLYDFRR